MGRARSLARRPAAVLIALVVVCLGGVLAARGGIAIASRALERRYPPPGRMISVGSHKLHLYCEGTGHPTVIIESGLGTDWVSWSRVVAQMAVHTRVCVYDRAGYGWSESGPMPRTAERAAGDLHALLTQLEAHPAPYLLVAHSYGGHVARLFASRYPELVSGVLLVAPFEPDPRSFVDSTSRSFHWRLDWMIKDALPPLGWRHLKTLYGGENTLPPAVQQLPPAFRRRAIVNWSLPQAAAMKSEYASSAESHAQASQARFPATMPLIVVTPPSAPAREVRLASLSARGRHVIAERSRHFVQIDEPDLVVQLIRNLIESGSAPGLQPSR